MQHTTKTRAGSYSHPMRQAAVLAALMVLPVLACSDETARIEGQMGDRAAAVGATRQPLSASPVGAGLGVRTFPLTDSSETSLDGLSIEMVEAAEGPPPDYTRTDLGEIFTTTPDDRGSFSFDEIPVPKRGFYQIRIVQDPDALVRYGGAGDIIYLQADDRVQVSLPLLTRLYLPMWNDVAVPAPQEIGFQGMRMAAARHHRKLVYLSPMQGVGVYDPRTATVDLLLMVEALRFDCGYSEGTGDGCWENQVYFIEEANQIVVARRVRLAESPERFILIDLDIFTDDNASETLDLDDPATAAALDGRVTIIDTLGEPWDCMPTRHDFYSAMFQPVSVMTADGSRYYCADRGRTDVFDLSTRTLIESWKCDGGILGAYNPHADHLYLDLPGGTLRVTEAATGETVRDLDLGARVHNGIAVVGFSDYPRAVVSYQSDTTPAQHRIAVIGVDGTVESDYLASDFLGFTDRYFDPAFEWAGQCTPQYYDEHPDEPGPPVDVFTTVEEMLNTQVLPMYFDQASGQLVINDYLFQLRDDLFYPMPSRWCTIFGNVPHECNGGTWYHDQVHRVALIRGGAETEMTCIVHIDWSDIAVTVHLDGVAGGFDTFLPFSELGAGFVATSTSVTVMHYRSPDAAFLPAIRDLR